MHKRTWARTRGAVQWNTGADRGRRSYRNPALAAERARKRGELLDAHRAGADRHLGRIRRRPAAARRRTRSAWRSARARPRKVAKHFQITITDSDLRFVRDEAASPPSGHSARIARELKPAALDWLTALPRAGDPSAASRAPRRANAAAVVWSSARAVASLDAGIEHAPRSRDRRPPCLLRESYRDGAKGKNRTLKNSRTGRPSDRLLRAVLRGDTLVPAGEGLEIVRACRRAGMCSPRSARRGRISSTVPACAARRAGLGGSARSRTYMCSLQIIRRRTLSSKF